MARIPGWNRSRSRSVRLDSTAISPAASGALRVVDLITHTFPLERAAEAFHLLDVASQDVLQVALEVER